MNDKRILLECGQTLEPGLGYNTGIQRVARNLASQSLGQGAAVGVNCLPVMRSSTWLVDATQRLCNPPRNVAFGGPASPTFPGAGLGSIPAASAWRRVQTRLRKLFYPRTLVRAAQQANWWLRGQVVTPGPGDIVVFLGGWWIKGLWRCLERVKQSGAQIGFVAYDLLPISLPHFFADDLIHPFRVYLDRALREADFFLAISQTVQDEFQRYAAGVLGAAAAAELITDSFRLGANLNPTHRGGEVRGSVREIFQSGQASAPWLTVGTLEPRKNHVLLLDAFDRVWEACPHARLCIVGGVGWMCDDLLRRLDSHPRLGRQLHVLTDATDEELEYCYQHAQALIFPSHGEGFGLPLVEGLRHGLQVLASDIPIHREVGQDRCIYFDISSPATLAQLVLAQETRGMLPRVRPWDPAELIDWESSCRQFLEKCLAASDRAARR